MESDKESRINRCPNCGDTNIKRKGKEILCLQCNCIFAITDKGEAKVKVLGALDEIHERLDTLEQTVYPAEQPDESEDLDESENDDWGFL